ncbi:MotA/TolQ/ExbB proton channel family protein [Halanaerobacter jeridensis]|uniref:Biopolymer transport protein ExbB n=1 Tax=Halanaerobacter jeridensis TaxID=706427 RepID=A0A938XQW0_9FIRM|nr:MotA/TolQ/ExbB proton channel family protein [Halanaerobacter jeridensis]MBM7555989.1 biopolymer transport protein ExbB [Halanaerobacter jeridensis]
MLNVLKQGGVTIIPLIIFSVISLAISIERIIYLKKAKTNNYNLINKVRVKLNDDKVKEVKSILEDKQAPVAGMLLEGLNYIGQGKEELRKNLELIGSNQVKKLEKRLKALNFIASVSPLLGLLGTVLGIIDSFNILAAAQGVANPGALSVGIAQALISTAVGLIVAIPTMLMYSYLTGLVDKRTSEMNRWFADVVEVLGQGGKNV